MEKKSLKQKRKAAQVMVFCCFFLIRVSFGQDLLNNHSLLFYDNEQTVKFDFNLKL